MTCKHKDKSLLFSIDSFSVVECKKCGIRKISPLPPENEIEVFYAGKFYCGGDSRRFSLVFEILVRFFRFLRALEIAKFGDVGRVLDVGCGRGLMLFYLKKYFGVSYVTGTQFSDLAIRNIREKFGIEIKKGRLEDNIIDIEGEFDVICFWHVLEHIDNVDSAIYLSRNFLSLCGKLLIEVPNSESFSKKLTGASWLGWDLPNHLTHFTPESLEELLKKYNFRIVKKKFFSLEYSIFTTLQSFLNKIYGRENIFYKSFLVNKNKSFNFIEVVLHVLSAMALLPAAVILNFIFYKSKKGEVIHYVAVKEK